MINRLDYDYTTLTHLLHPLAVGLPSQKRPASPSLKSEERPPCKRPSKGMAPIITQASSFRTKSSDASPPSQVEGNPQSQCRESVGSLYYPPPELAQQVHQDVSCQDIGASGFTHIALQPSNFEYGYGSGDVEIPSVNQDQVIGTNKCVDDASQSINLDSAYGSRVETIPSSSNLHPSIMLSPILPKLDRPDSGIPLSSNASVLTDPAGTQPQSGSATQDGRDRPCFHPPHLDPNLPSNMIPLEEQTYFGFSSEGLLNPYLYGSLDHHGQKST